MTSRWILCVCLVVPFGCGSTRKIEPETKEAVAPALPPAWTDAFQQASLLTASEIRIEGPEGLIAHVATRRDAAHDHVEKTIPDGFLQETTVRPDASDVEIRAQIDNLVIAATKKLVVLERPGPVDVVVIARGDAYFKNQATKEERREGTLRLEGKIRR